MSSLGSHGILHCTCPTVTSHLGYATLPWFSSTLPPGQARIPANPLPQVEVIISVCTHLMTVEQLLF